ncbi:MAG: citramalate synthase [Oscillospiraceae bacterium]|jgi:2-isopropylmalate synthase|nr:citramalate synthase [Oscillospiraceae bacterium]
MNEKIMILDTTLRDGAQAPGVSFSVADKIDVVCTLDELGVDYIEAGNPASNPKDMDFYARMRGRTLRHARLAAFGATRRKHMTAARDDHLAALLAAETPVVVIFGKTWKLHLSTVLACSEAENLAMIADTVSFLKAQGREVIYDAEHFFDGYRDDPDYAMETLHAARRAGADTLVLCDTNGGAFPGDVARITAAAAAGLDVPPGIHCHNDGGMAVASSLMAVQAGARHVQGTINGIGERCGNASLACLTANLQGKGGYRCLPELARLTHAARQIAEVANVIIPDGAPYVGAGAFAHKAGMHLDGVAKLPATFEHIDPALVGNRRRMLTSEMAGRAALLPRLQAYDASVTRDSPTLLAALRRLKEKEHEGYQYEAAEASFDLVLRRLTGMYRPCFELLHFKIIGEHRPHLSATAVIKIRVGEREEISAAEGNGPVHALDRALRRALEVFYPQVAGIRLIDYKVRVLDAAEATDARVRVLITSTDGREVWTTVGVSQDIIRASFEALADSMEYHCHQGI